MSKSVFVSIVVFSMVVFSCGSGENAKRESSSRKSKDMGKEMTIETYAKIVNEQRALLVEKYWPKFKDQNYEDVKNELESFLEEEKDIIEKYGFDRDFDLPVYFRRNMKEVMTYQKSNPDYKDYPEYGDAKNKVVSLMMKKVK